MKMLAPVFQKPWTAKTISVSQPGLMDGIQNRPVNLESPAPSILAAPERSPGKSSINCLIRYKAKEEPIVEQNGKVTVNPAEVCHNNMEVEIELAAHRDIRDTWKC